MVLHQPIGPLERFVHDEVDSAIKRCSMGFLPSVPRMFADVVTQSDRTNPNVLGASTSTMLSTGSTSVLGASTGCPLWVTYLQQHNPAALAWIEMNGWKTPWRVAGEAQGAIYGGGDKGGGGGSSGFTENTIAHGKGQQRIPVNPTPTKSPTPKPEPDPVPRFVPKLIHGVEVYGLNEKITTENQIRELYRYLDFQFAEQNGIAIQTDKALRGDQRRNILNPNERYVEIVILQSAYDSFLVRQKETGIDFVEWIQMHLDLMNRITANRVPPIDLKSVLRRVIVVSDDMPSNFYDSSKQATLGGALDYVWSNHFRDVRPIDTDMTWSVAQDYRPDPSITKVKDFFWNVRQTNDMTVLGYPPGAKTYTQTYEFPHKNDSLDNKQDVWIDMGMIHEWSHYLWNLPDQNDFDIKNDQPLKGNMTQFTEFSTVTGYNFQEPNLSAYLANLLDANVQQRNRGAFDNISKIYDLSARPSSISIRITEGESAASDVHVYKIRNTKNDFYGIKNIANTPSYEVSGNEVTLYSNFFDDAATYKGPYDVLVTAMVHGERKQVILPASAFQMSKNAGKDSVTYTIDTSGYDDSKATIQNLDIVDNEHLSSYMNNTNTQDGIVYARMKVEGTNAWFVWEIDETKDVKAASKAKQIYEGDQ